MLTLPAAFTAAAAVSGHEPIWLLELPALGVLLSSHQVEVGRTWSIGDANLVLGTAWTLGESLIYDGRIAESGMGRLVRALDDSGQASRVGNLDVTLLNHDDYAATLLAQSVDNTAVRLLMGFRGLRYPNYVTLFNGVVDNTEDSLLDLTLNIIDDTLRAYRDLSTAIGSQYYPGTPVVNRGKPIPILIGRNTDIEALQVIGPAAGSLALTLTSSADELLLAEIGATFPASGTITVGSETGVTYAGRSYTTALGVTYMRLTGLVRGAPVSQAAGLAVTLTGVDPVYLVGYETGDVTAVRDDGVLVNPANYTASVDSTSAPTSTTIVTFTSAPSGLVTVDADGLNVQDVGEITNGDFETGDITGWTELAPASMTASTGDASDPTSTYKAELTGSEGVYEEAYADFTTVVDDYYTVEVDYRDTVVDNLMTNSDFADGLTGWTTNSESDNGQATVPADTYGMVALGAVSGGGDLRTYRYFLVQDVTTVVSSDYTLSFSYQGFFWRGGGGTPTANTVGSGGVCTFVQGGWRVGTTSDDDALVSRPADQEPQWEHNSRIWQEATVEFTATETTTRITFEAYGRVRNAAFYPLYIRDIQLTQSTGLPTSDSAIQLGTTSDATAYADTALPRRYAWARTQTVFQATETTTRVTLRSKWTHLSTPSWFDNVRLHDGGRNPSEAIAYVIDTFLPDITRDTASFDTAYEKLTDWQFGGVFTQPGDSRALLDDMAWQCNSRLIRSTDNTIKLQVRDGQLTTDLVSIDHNTIVDGTYRARREPMENIFTDYVIWFGRASGEVEDQQGFQASVNASPDSTTHPSDALDARCAGAATLYGTRRKLERRADMIRDLNTAHLLLEALVERHTQRELDISLNVFHHAGVRLEEGDYVEVIYSRLAGGKAWLCEVLSKEIGAEDVALRLRTLGPNGFYETWDFPLELSEVGLFIEPWSA